ncbi:MAG: hypothetical protein HZB76_02155 [Chlamydiae bacterium]|nr:hypothetical protein [Chlamydiota bacterium]
MVKPLFRKLLSAASHRNVHNILQMAASRNTRKITLTTNTQTPKDAEEKKDRTFCITMTVLGILAVVAVVAALVIFFPHVFTSTVIVGGVVATAVVGFFALFAIGSGDKSFGSFSSHSWSRGGGSCGFLH